MFLFAEWVKISLDTGGYSLQLQKRQVKPSILYIAKKFGFELLEHDLTNTYENYVKHKDGAPRNYFL